MHNYPSHTVIQPGLSVLWVGFLCFHKQTTPEFVFKWVETTFFSWSQTDCFVMIPNALPCSYMPKQTKLKEKMRSKVPKQMLQTNQVWKRPYSKCTFILLHNLSTFKGLWIQTCVRRCRCSGPLRPCFLSSILNGFKRDFASAFWALCKDALSWACNDFCSSIKACWNRDALSLSCHKSQKKTGQDKAQEKQKR